MAKIIDYNYSYGTPNQMVDNIMDVYDFPDQHPDLMNLMDKSIKRQTKNIWLKKHNRQD